MENKGLQLKKTEKLVTAIYMLTSFFDEKEPMKWRLRELGSKLLAVKDNHVVVQEILSLLTVAKHSGLITDMNYEIIYGEFSKLLPEPLSIQHLLAHNVSEDEKRDVMPHTAIRSEESLYVGSSVPAIAQPQAPAVAEPTAGLLDMSQLKDRAHVTHTDEKRPLKEFGAVAVKKNSRQSIIIGLLKRKKEIMIKDVSPLIDGVSEKTIQRELLTMVAAGILKKEGEKRWSRYSLADKA